MKVCRKIFFLLAIIAASEISAAPQDDAPEGADIEAAKLETELKWLKDETYVITASKTPERISKSAATVTVITDVEIRNMGARQLMDVLSTVPGLGVTINSSGYYQLEARGVQSSETEKILLMQNGHSLNTVLTGGAFQSFHNLIVDNIKKIEIVRGPGSAMYGANAFLAVVNIITKDAVDVDGLELTAAGGSYQTQQYNLMFGKEIKGLNLYANFNFLNTDGYKGYVPQDVQTINDINMGTNASLAPGYTNSRLSKFDLDFGAKYQDFAFTGRYIKDKRGMFAGIGGALSDTSYQNFEDYFIELSYAPALTENLDLSAKVYRDFNRWGDNYFVVFPPGFAGVFPDGLIGAPWQKATKTGAETQLVWDSTQSNKVIAGVTVEHQKQYDVGQALNFDPATGAPLGSLQDVTSTANWSKNTSRNFWAVYGEDIFDIQSNLRLTTGARYDRYSDFGGSFNPRAGLAWEFSEGHDFKLIYGSAFRAPAFGELYQTNNPVVNGNPNLMPETIKTWEASLGSELSRSTSSRITLFRNDIENLIESSPPDPVTGLSLYANSPGIVSEGVELELKTKFDEGSYLASNCTLQNPRNKITGRLADVPSQKANVIANWQINSQFNLNTQLVLKGSTPRATGDARDAAPGYGLLNTTLIARNGLRKWGEMELRLSIQNLLNREYSDPAPAGTLAADYPKPGRSFLVEAYYTY